MLKKSCIKILITEGENRSSLAVTRSLGMAGCNVVVTGVEKKSISSQSRYCTASYQVVSPLESENKYLDEIVNLSEQEKIDYIVPMTEPAMFVLSKNRQTLPAKTILAAPSHDKVKIIFDKVAVFQLAKKHGIDIPKSYFISSYDDFLSKVKKIDEFPVVIKPGMSSIPTKKGFISTGVKYAKNKEELVHLYKTDEALQYPSMIQEKITGPGTGLFTLFDNDRHLALFSHERLREKPPSGGVSVVCKSVPLNTDMVQSAQRLLSDVGWQGVAMVEFKRDIRDGKPKLMEINGRFWGSLQLAISAGVDFPKLLLKYLQKDKIYSNYGEYKTGLKLKWLLGTLDHLIIRLKNKDSALNLPPGFPNKIDSLIDFFKVKDTNTVFDVLDRRDMSPFFYELRKYINDILH